MDKFSFNCSREVIQTEESDGTKIFPYDYNNYKPTVPASRISEESKSSVFKSTSNSHVSNLNLDSFKFTGSKR